MAFPDPVYTLGTELPYYAHLALNHFDLQLSGQQFGPAAIISSLN